VHLVFEPYFKDACWLMCDCNRVHGMQVNNDAAEAVRHDHAAQYFLEVMEELAWVYLQDTAILMDDYPEHPSFHITRILRHPQWAAFRDAVLDLHLRAPTFPNQVLLNTIS
jgi:hypothetical protein